MAMSNPPRAAVSEEERKWVMPERPGLVVLGTARRSPCP
jgi:hypothetical protein